MPSPDNRKQDRIWLETMVEVPSGVGDDDEHWTSTNN
ncbi:unnamed protein product, partial [Arctia plantaginis]